MNLALPDFVVHHPRSIPCGTSLFLLHGAFGAKDYWRMQVDAFTAAGYRVVSWDAPGYGLSPLPENFDIDLAAQALAQLLRAVGESRNVVLGHSMGGMVAQRAWLYARSHIQGYVLSATSAAFGRTDGDWQKEFVRARVAPLDAGRSISDYAPEMLRAMMSPDAQGEAVDLMIDTVKNMREDTFRAAIVAIAGYEGRELLPTIDVPTLCIAGELDTTAPAAVMEKMARKIPHAEFSVLQGLGHFGWAEDPVRFNRTVLEFLSRHAYSTSA